MKYLTGSELIEQLPLVLSGPILSKTQATDVTVWIALKQPCQVKLKVFETFNRGEQIGQCIFTGQRQTAAIGAYLHIAAVTAKPIVKSAAKSIQEKPTEDKTLTSRTLTPKTLTCDRIYAYDLTFEPTALQKNIAEENIAEESATEEKTTAFSLLESLSLQQTPTDALSYFSHQKPTFTLPPADLSDLKIVHGSCRKPHGRGFDALPILDCLLKSDAADPKKRAHQLIMTGDQIYGDDVADPLLWLATSLGNTLLGWEEKLPLNEDAPKLAGPGQNWVYPHQLPAGRRADFTTQQAGMTAGLTNKKERTTSHLLSFGEYCATYLLAYSPACWPKQLPTGKAVTSGWNKIRHWNKDKRNMEQTLHTLWKVRRLMANIPTYTIFDDHDVSDDWNLNQDWCLRTLGKPLGKRTVQNALLSYAIFQAWGNTPEQFEPTPESSTEEQTAGNLLLEATEKWSHTKGESAEAIEAIAHLLGLPKIDPHTQLPQFTQDKGTWVLSKEPPYLKWNYTIHSACHDIILLDSRTWRGYPMDGDPLSPPMLLSPSAFETQLEQPLSKRPPNPNKCTFIVAPTNVFGMRALDWIQNWHLERRKVFTADVGDSWNFNDRALAQLLSTLFRHRKKVVVLSGDIHYSSAINVDYKQLASGDQANLVQFTASAIKNEETLTRILHTRLKDWLLPERSRHWVGWDSPPDMKEIDPNKEQHKSYTAQTTGTQTTGAQTTKPDWQCEMRWLKRSPAQSVNITSSLPELIPPHKQPTPFLRWLQFWKARWLQEGHEVVGMNNIAVVYFQPISTESPELTIKQKHYWFSPWSPTEVVCSGFE